MLKKIALGIIVIFAILELFEDEAVSSKNNETLLNV